MSALPWERLETFSKIPAVSRDYSLNIFAKRLKSIGFKAESNNSLGIAKDKIKFTSYEFKPTADQVAGGTGSKATAANNTAGGDQTDKSKEVPIIEKI